MMSKGKDLMIITYSAMSKSRAIMALDLNLEKRLLEGVSYFSFATLEKRKKLGRLTLTKTSGTVLLGTGKIIGKLLTGASQVSIPETIAGYVFWLYSMFARKGISKAGSRKRARRPFTSLLSPFRDPLRFGTSH